MGPTLGAHAERVMADRNAIEQWLAGQAGQWARQGVAVVGNIGRNVAGAAVAVLTLFFFCRHGDALLAQVRRAVRRLAGARGHALLAPLGETLQAVTYGILLTALAQGRPLAALLLLAWGMLVVSTIDNVVRSWVISSATRVPFLLIFFAVIGGLASFGLLGLFVGPATVSLLLVLWREATASDPDAAC